ncbi:hypothetical protein [Pseudomonas sp. CGJS7]|uniref:hypothetical protein n=1 Tax=Pseudomonas sp. CGJS7 TaxID=3109348 RepID=UPI00300A502A
MSAVMGQGEVLQRNAALGLRFWDVAAATTAIDGLVVEIYPRSDPFARKRALPNPSGIYVAHRLPLLAAFEFDDSQPAGQPWIDAASGSPPLLRGYRIEVSDPQGRYLPIAFDAELPVRGLFDWLAPWISPPQALLWPGDAGSPPQWLIQRIPLFSAPRRAPPSPLAVLYAQMRETGSNRVAAWSLLAVSIAGQRRGIGLADREGRVAVMFPYPEPPRAPLASPPAERADFAWSVELEAYWSPLSPPPEPPLVPDLAQVLMQLSTPCTVLDSLSSPAPRRRLDYRRAMTARTEGQGAADASWLLLSTA